jgi:hypothetical protein
VTREQGGQQGGQEGGDWLASSDSVGQQWSAGGGKIVKFVVSSNPTDILNSIGISKACGGLAVETGATAEIAPQK